MNNEEKMQSMMKKKIWALVGATPNTGKTANHIYHTLLDHGYTVYPINPNYSKMENGAACYPDFESLPETPDCIDFVVPPAVTLEHLKKIDPSVIPSIWLQPGTYNDDVVRFAEEKGFQVVHEGACCMAYLRLCG